MGVLNRRDPDLADCHIDISVTASHRIWNRSGIILVSQNRLMTWSNMPRNSISRSDLHRRLITFALLRSLLTMLAAVGGICLVPSIPEMPRGPSELVFLAGLGVAGIVCWVFTVLICRRVVTCPFCTKSLWSCGTGNFKPRRMEVRDDVSSCPNCGVPIV